jgi:hypothetical protein
MMMNVEQPAEYFAGETEVLGENPPQCRFVHQNSHMACPRLEPEPPIRIKAKELTFLKQVSFSSIIVEL